MFKYQIVIISITYLIKNVDASPVKHAFLKVIDKLEEFIKETSIKTDDILLLPILEVLKNSVNKLDFESCLNTLPLVFKSIDSEHIKLLIDGFLDSLEEYVRDTDTKIDDFVFLPSIKLVRSALDLPN